jgi:hypothetical protein
MGKAIINKHIDDKSTVSRDIFVKDLEKAKGEIVINNDVNEPSIYIVNNNNEVVKISGSGSSGGGGSYDDTAIRSELNKVKTNVEILQGDVEGDKEKSVREIATEVMGGSTPGSSEDVIELQKTLTGFTSTNTVQDAVNSLNVVQSAHTETLQTLEAGISANTESISTLQNSLSATTENTTNLQNAVTGLTETVNAQGNSINNNANSISALTETTKSLGETLNVLTGEDEGSIKKAIQDTKDVIDAYTINGQVLSGSPVLTSDSFEVTETYSTLGQKIEGVIPGDILTTAISKLEVSLANTTLALSAALNDIERRLGTASYYDEEGNMHKGTGLVGDYEELLKDVRQLEFKVSQYHPN